MQYLNRGLSNSQNISKTHLTHLAPAVLGDRDMRHSGFFYKPAIKINVMAPQTYCVIILLGFHKTESD